MLGYLDRVLARKGHARRGRRRGRGAGVDGRRRRRRAARTRAATRSSRTSASFLRERITEHYQRAGREVTLNYIDPSYTIRSVPATPSDSVYCWNMARNAVHAAMAGQHRDADRALARPLRARADGVGHPATASGSIRRATCGCRSSRRPDNRGRLRERGFRAFASRGDRRSGARVVSISIRITPLRAGVPEKRHSRLAPRPTVSASPTRRSAAWRARRRPPWRRRTASTSGRRSRARCRCRRSRGSSSA